MVETMTVAWFVPMASLTLHTHDSELVLDGQGFFVTFRRVIICQTTQAVTQLG